MDCANRWSSPVTRTAAMLVVVAAALAGCAAGPKPLYHWEGYQRQVYEFLKGDGTAPTEQMTVMQAQAEKARAAGAALPPGFRAHLGLLHIRLGRYDEARQMLEAEKAAFPESSTYMDFVLKSMGERKS
jgi:hypothetical protein